jgi:hypothetical protein
MKMIRFFLWGLVAAMTLQGFLHADDYGSAPTMFGGMGLTMSVWKESLTEGTRTLFWGRPQFVGLPRVLVQAALRETARHPGIHTVPALRRALESHERAWAAFRDAEVAWMLAHADLVGAVTVEPDARALWEPWATLVTAIESELVEAQGSLCKVPRLSPTACGAAAARVADLEVALGRASRGMRAWRAFLELRGPIEVAWWWRVTRLDLNGTDTVWTEWAVDLSRLHNVSDPRDPRVSSLRSRAAAIAVAVTNEGGWERRILESLLLGELWTSCLNHVSAREGRVRELMTVAGVSELFTAHERALNASLRVAKGSAEETQIQEWFSEMAGYAWWLGDDVPGLVRRCLASPQKTGECARSGPTEIAALSAQMDERARIVEDWSRRLFVGMWNAMPAVGLLFVVELLLICVEKRTGVTSLAVASAPLPQEPRTIILQLQGPASSADRQLITA